MRNWKTIQVQENIFGQKRWQNQSTKHKNKFETLVKDGSKMTLFDLQGE